MSNRTAQANKAVMQAWENEHRLVSEGRGTLKTPHDSSAYRDYATSDKWQGYAASNDRKTFMLLFEKDFLEMAAARYEQNEDFFVRMFKETEMMGQIMRAVGGVLYERLKMRYRARG